MPSRLPEYAIRNREVWTKSNAAYTAASARESWAQEEIRWGVWKTPESEINVLPDLRGLEVIELGCGTAYFGAWLKKHGAKRVLGVDITPAQLDTGKWRGVADPASLEAAASALGPSLNSAPPAYFDFEPAPFLRPFDLGGAH